MAGKKGMRHYTLALKQQAVELVLQHRHTYAEIAAQLELREVQCLKRWVRDYRREGPAGLCKAQGRPRQQSPTDLARLQMENVLLKKWHSELRPLMHAKRNIGSSSTIGDSFP